MHRPEDVLHKQVFPSRKREERYASGRMRAPFRAVSSILSGAFNDGLKAIESYKEDMRLYPWRRGNGRNCKAQMEEIFAVASNPSKKRGLLFLRVYLLRRVPPPPRRPPPAAAERLFSICWPLTGPLKTLESSVRLNQLNFSTCLFRFSILEDAGDAFPRGDTETACQ